MHSSNKVRLTSNHFNRVKDPSIVWAQMMHVLELYVIVQPGPEKQPCLSSTRTQIHLCLWALVALVGNRFFFFFFSTFNCLFVFPGLWSIICLVVQIEVSGWCFRENVPLDLDLDEGGGSSRKALAFLHLGLQRSPCSSQKSIVHFENLAYWILFWIVWVT